MPLTMCQVIDEILHNFTPAEVTDSDKEKKKKEGGWKTREKMKNKGKKKQRRRGKSRKYNTMNENKESSKKKKKKKNRGLADLLNIPKTMMSNGSTVYMHVVKWNAKNGFRPSQVRCCAFYMKLLCRIMEVKHTVLLPW